MSSESINDAIGEFHVIDSPCASEIVATVSLGDLTTIVGEQRIGADHSPVQP
jgi:hypothetical protein